MSLHAPTKGSPLMIRSWPRAILHIDTDAFFAACEQSLHPEYRGKPVVTGKERGIVATSSYEARARGVKRGVPLWEVKKLCPDAIILPSDYETYSLFSKRMFEIMRRFTPEVEEYSIDEAFAEITGMRRLYHANYLEIAKRIKTTIEQELGITVSVGLSLSKTLAKIASGYKKPAGFTPIPGRAIHTFLARILIEDVWGIGPQTTAYCKALKIKTALDFAQLDKTYVEKHFTKPHQEAWYELNGSAIYQISTQEKTDYASIGKTKTFTPASSKESVVFAHLLKNLENACIKARRHSLVAQKITLFLKSQDFRGAGIEAALSRPSAYPSDMTEVVRSLFKKIYRPSTLYRSTGVILTNLVENRVLQQSLFEPPLRIEKIQRAFDAVDLLSKRMGKHTVHLAGSHAAHKTPQHVLERGDVPVRKLTRLTGESKRKHLPLPMLMHPEDA